MHLYQRGAIQWDATDVWGELPQTASLGSATGKYKETVFHHKCVSPYLKGQCLFLSRCVIDCIWLLSTGMTVRALNFGEHSGLTASFEENTAKIMKSPEVCVEKDLGETQTAFFFQSCSQKWRRWRTQWAHRDRNRWCGCSCSFCNVAVFHQLSCFFSSPHVTKQL